MPTRCIALAVFLACLVLCTGAAPAVAVPPGPDAAVMSVPTPAPQPLPPDVAFDDLVRVGRDAWTAAQLGKWSLAMGLALWLAVGLLRFKALGLITERIPARYRVALPLALGGLASALLALSGHGPDTEVGTAVLGLSGAATAVLVHEVHEAVTGKRERARLTGEK